MCYYVIFFKDKTLFSLKDFTYIIKKYKIKKARCRQDITVIMITSQDVKLGEKFRVQLIPYHLEKSVRALPHSPFTVMNLEPDQIKISKSARLHKLLKYSARVQGSIFIYSERASKATNNLCQYMEINTRECYRNF